MSTTVKLNQNPDSRDAELQLAGNSLELKANPGGNKSTSNGSK